MSETGDGRPDHRERPPEPRAEAGRLAGRAAGPSEAALRRIGDALHDLRYGSVLAIVQDGVVVQIERTEKTRFAR
jgi:hypothetical protein